MQFWESIKGAIVSAKINEPTTFTDIAKRSGMTRQALSKFLRASENGMTPRHLSGVLRALRLRVEVLRK